MAASGRGRDLFAMVPERIREWVEDTDGNVKILTPRYGDSALGCWLGRRLGKPFIEIRLDDIGSAIWKACDGEVTVASIAERLAAEFGGRVEPVPERLRTFFTLLDRNRCIRWVRTGQ